MLENSWFKKEKPFLGLTGLGGGVGSHLSKSGLNIVGADVSGGIMHEYQDGPTGSKYRIHMFIEPGSFTVNAVDPAVNSMTYLVVGGGGGGGGDNGGGGGGGGVRTGSVTMSKLTYPVVVGWGGATTWTASEGTPAKPGGESLFIDPSGPSTYQGGGGGGGGANNGNGQPGRSPGGSGGGGGYNIPGGGGNGDPGATSGGNGGDGNAPKGGGGGGGCGPTSGQAATGNAQGGDGLEVIMFPTTFMPTPYQYWAGGGAGCRHPGANPTTGSEGGTGGGGGGAPAGGAPITGYGGAGFNQGYFARQDPGGNPKSNSGGDAGMFTGGGGGGGGSQRSNSNTPAMSGPVHYDPSTAWQTSGGLGSPGMVMFKYQIPDAYDLTYNKFQGPGTVHNERCGFVHRNQTTGKVYHVFVRPTFQGGPGGQGGQPQARGGELTTSPTQSPFPASILLVGGGGGGGGCKPSNRWPGGGGGAGAVVVNPDYTFTGGKTMYVRVGSGGQGAGYGYDSPAFPYWNSTGTMGDTTYLEVPSLPAVYASGGGGGGVDWGGGGIGGEPGGAPAYPVPERNGAGGGGAAQANPTNSDGYPTRVNGSGGNGATYSGWGSQPGTWTAYGEPGGQGGGPGNPTNPTHSSGGGGGATSSGTKGTNPNLGGDGGNGKDVPFVPLTIGVGRPGPVADVAHFGGGGAGGAMNPNPTNSAGGNGGYGGGGGYGPNNPTFPPTGGPGDDDSSGPAPDGYGVYKAKCGYMGSGGGGAGAGTANGSWGIGGKGGTGCIVITYDA